MCRLLDSYGVAASLPPGRPGGQFLVVGTGKVAAAAIAVVLASAALSAGLVGRSPSPADPLPTTAQPTGPVTQAPSNAGTSSTPDHRAELAAIAERDSAEAAVTQMLAWVQTDDQYARACHNDAHMLGALSARLEGGAAVIGLSTAACDFGFIHGVLKATALDAPDDVDPNELAALCALAPDDIVSNCDHGLGHAIPLRDRLSYSEGIAMCLQLTEEERQAQCVNGVMMEFGVNYMYFHDLRSLDPGSVDAAGVLQPLELTTDERAQPCKALVAVGAGPLDICYRHLHYFWSPELGEDYIEFERRCLGLTDDKNHSCLQSLGAWVWYEEELWADDPLVEHKATLDATCMALSSEVGRQWCIYGYVHTIWQSEPNPQNIPSLCAYLGEVYEPGCSTSELRFRPLP